MWSVLALEMNTRYALATGTQVREEDFGLLFYTKSGPRLYFLSSGELLKEDFFGSGFTFEKWLDRRKVEEPVSKERLIELGNGLNDLREKGVILEC